MAGQKKSQIQTVEDMRRFLEEKFGPGSSNPKSPEWIAESVTRWARNRAFQGIVAGMIGPIQSQAKLIGDLYKTALMGYAQACFRLLLKRGGDKDSYEDDVKGATGLHNYYVKAKLSGAPAAFDTALTTIEDEVYRVGIGIMAQYSATTEGTTPAK